LLHVGGKLLQKTQKKALQQLEK